jgi:hypothetical protein
MNSTFYWTDALRAKMSHERRWRDLLRKQEVYPPGRA